MKLKRLLAGALAAAVAVTTIAVSAFTTASADGIEPDNGWYKETGVLEGDQFKLIQDWGNSTKLPELYKQSELYITFDVTGITTPIQAYMIFSNGADWTAWTPNENGNPAIPISKNGTYTVAWNGTAVNAEVVLFLAVAFIDQSGAQYYAADAGVTATLKSVTLEKPAETPTEKPTDSAGPDEDTEEAINSITYNYNVTAGSATTLKWENQEAGYIGHSAETAITGTGSYSTTISGLTGNGLTNLGFFSDNNKGAVALTVDTIVINGKHTFNVNAALTTDANSNGLANIWNDLGKAAVVPYTSVDGDCYLAGSSSDSVGIKLMIGKINDNPTEEPTEEPTGTPTPAEGYAAFLMFADDTWSGWGNWNPNDGSEESGYGTDAMITGDGTYTVSLSGDQAGWYVTDPNVHVSPDTPGAVFASAKGVQVFNVDMKGLAAAYNVATTKDEGLSPAEAKQRVTDAGITIKDVTVNIDPDDTQFGTKDFVLDNSKLLYGDIEGNGNIRLELYNPGGGGLTADATSEFYDADFAAICDEFEANTIIQVTFTIEGLDEPVEPTEEPSEDPTDEPTDEPTEEPTEAADVTVSVVPDKAYAKPGDEVTYTVHVDSAFPLYTLQMQLVIPEGLTYVANSGALVEGIQDTLGFDNVGWTEQTLIINGVATAPKDVTSFDLATFKCTVDEGVADGTALELGLTYLEFCKDLHFNPADVISAAVPGVVTVGEDPNPTEEPTDEPTEEPSDGGDATKAPSDGGSTATPTEKPADNNSNNGNNGGNNNSNNGGANGTGTSATDKPVNTGAQTAVGLSAFLAAAAIGLVALKKRNR